MKSTNLSKNLSNSPCKTLLKTKGTFGCNYVKLIAPFDRVKNTTKRILKFSREIQREFGTVSIKSSLLVRYQHKEKLICIFI